MFSSSVIAPDLIRAYLTTDYHVHAQPPYVLKIAQHSPMLAMAYAQHQVTSAALLTACNPYSCTQLPEQNQRAMDQLCHELKQQNVLFIRGVGASTQEQWPEEASVLALGVTFELAKNLGTKYQQNAVVWINEDAVPQLIMLR